MSLLVRTDSGFVNQQSPSPSPPSTNGSYQPSPSPIGSPIWREREAKGEVGRDGMKSPLSGSQLASPSAGNNGSSSSVTSPPIQSTNILVSIRIRPMNDREVQSGEQTIWRTHAQTNSIEEEHDPIGKRYAFDYIAPAEENTTELYKNLVRKLVLKACIGYNSNIFAYGQTASGKTHTVLGNEYSPGIVLLAIGDIFHYIAQSPNRQFLLRISCLEIYNEEINDLLSTGPSSRNLKLENVGGLNKDGTFNPFATNVGVKIKGLTQEFVKSPAEFIQLLLRGEENRKIASTDANLRSSRSHTMFRIHIESRARSIPGTAPGTPGTASKKIRSSLLTFVDLAGSECISQLGGSVERQKECRYINKSLLGLSRVIVKLAEGQSSLDGGHIPYRDSTITRVLKPALGGNSHTLFICCISPLTQCREESHNTLRFGSFASKVQNIAKVNLKDEKQKSDLEKYREELERMKNEMEERKRLEADELDRLRQQNASLKSLLEQKDAHLSQSSTDATDALNAAEKAAEAVRESQRLLELERLEKEKLSLNKSHLDSTEQENSYLKMQLKISQAQIALLEEKMVPMIEEASANKFDGKESEQEKMKELLDTINALRDTNSNLSLTREQEREEYELERKKIDQEKDQLLKQLLADKITEQQKLESRIAHEQSQLQAARLFSMAQGAANGILKACKGKTSTHAIKLWYIEKDVPSPRVYWTRVGLGGTFTKERFIQLKDLERIKSGQSTPIFDKLQDASLKYPEVKNRSLSLITNARTLDLIFPTTQQSELWLEGLRTLVQGQDVKFEEHRPEKMKSKLKPVDGNNAASAASSPLAAQVSKEKLQEEEKKSVTFAPPTATSSAPSTAATSSSSSSSTAAASASAASSVPQEEEKTQDPPAAATSSNTATDSTGFVARQVQSRPRVLQVGDVTFEDEPPEEAENKSTQPTSDTITSS